MRDTFARTISKYPNERLYRLLIFTGKAPKITAYEDHLLREVTYLKFSCIHYKDYDIEKLRNDKRLGARIMQAFVLKGTKTDSMSSIDVENYAGEVFDYINKFNKDDNEFGIAVSFINQLFGLKERKKNGQLCSKFVEDYGMNIDYNSTFEEMLQEKGIQKGIEIGQEKGIQKGIEIGQEKGIQIGQEKGLQKGIEIGIEKGVLDMAKSMLENGLTIELIAKITKLKKKQIM
ncbi:MAG: hypothetical protein LBJ61_13030, partial [Deltaproteobacteria bacterium]|nr:hypothetical protein [Deltaproteobacteria bacterium]